MNLIIKPDLTDTNCYRVIYKRSKENILQALIKIKEQRIIFTYLFEGLSPEELNWLTEQFKQLTNGSRN